MRYTGKCGLATTFPDSEGPRGLRRLTSASLYSPACAKTGDDAIVLHLLMLKKQRGRRSAAHVVSRPTRGWTTRLIQIRYSTMVKGFLRRFQFVSIRLYNGIAKRPYPLSGALP